MNTSVSYDYIVDLVDQILLVLVDFLPQLLTAIFVLFGGWYIIGYMINLVQTLLDKAHVDVTVSRFLVSVVRVILKAVLLISAATILGISMTSFIAILGAAGLAIGLSLQGSLSNFSGGIFLLIFKPFQVGELVKIDEYLGHIQEISIMYTTILSLDKTIVILPNGPIMNTNIVNMSRYPKRRIQIPIGIAYDADIDVARAVIMTILKQHPKIEQDEPCGVFVQGLGESSVDLIVRCFVAYIDFESTLFDLTEQIKKTLDNHDIEIPFPQRVIHMRS